MAAFPISIPVYCIFLSFFMILTHVTEHVTEPADPSVYTIMAPFSCKYSDFYTSKAFYELFKERKACTDLILSLSAHRVSGAAELSGSLSAPF